MIEVSLFATHIQHIQAAEALQGLIHAASTARAQGLPAIPARSPRP